MFLLRDSASRDHNHVIKNRIKTLKVLYVYKYSLKRYYLTLIRRAQTLISQKEFSKPSKVLFF